MIENVCLGQYIPGSSILHRLDPRIKILSFVIFMIISFMSGNIFSMSILILSVAVIILLSGVPLKVYFQSTKYILFLIFLSCVFNVFYDYGEAVFKFWVLTVTLESIKNSVIIILRVTSLMFVSSSVMFTTSHSNISFAIETFMKPLSIFKINAQDIATMITISLKFVPIIFEETNKIINAQRSRGADLDNKNIIKKVKSYIPIIFPLFFLSFKRASDLAVAMESRCYNNIIKRTSIREFKISILDISCLIYIIVILIGVVYCEYLMI
ncbi:MAG: energy-coupling factor transporter transmembrane protein EcfT [Oscillospiraceae bacterium]|jgi:energy-coupling factor transport system permease protein|nr:energy-coupling factor transporter transmembrane protein EcfT [Oscillospiraceae bacterium]